MKTLCLILLFHASLQLKCDKTQITAYVGGEFLLICKYDTNSLLFSKKYWCQGSSRSTCEIVVDSENVARSNKRHRSHVIDAGRRGLFVKVTALQFDDAGAYWVGIDRPYADVMISINLVITEVPVSKPGLRPLSSLTDRPTCWGQPVTVRCDCTRGTAVGYTWYQHTHHEDALLLHHSSDLHLHCGALIEDTGYHCVASNAISSQRSDVLSVQVLMTEGNSCIYVINIPGQPIYDCADRMRTTTTATTPPLTTTTPPPTTCQATMKIHSRTSNRSLCVNQTAQDFFFSRAWTGEPFWYMLVRWGSFATLLIFLCVVIECTRVRRRRVRRKREARFKRRPHLAK